MRFQLEFSFGDENSCSRLKEVPYLYSQIPTSRKIDCNALYRQGDRRKLTSPKRRANLRCTSTSIQRSVFDDLLFDEEHTDLLKHIQIVYLVIRCLFQKQKLREQEIILDRLFHSDIYIDISLSLPELNQNSPQILYFIRSDTDWFE